MDEENTIIFEIDLSTIGFVCRKMAKPDRGVMLITGMNKKIDYDI